MTNRQLNSATGILIFLALISGCAPNLQESKQNSSLAVPTEFSDVKSETASLEIKNWDDFFPDEQLKSLIKLALEGNQELRVFEQEINIANSEVMARGGEPFPKLGLSGKAGIEKVGKETSQGTSDDVNGVPERIRDVKFGFAATWEIDIWKKLRNATKSAYFHYLSSVEGKNFLVTQMISEVANTYFELLALDSQIEIIDSYLKVLARITEIVGLQMSAARVTSLPVKRFEAEMFKNQVKKVELQQQVLMAQNRLSNLVGHFPEKIVRDSQKFMGLKMPQVEVGIPSRLLENRPDVKAASLEIESMKLNLASAKAKFYPSLNIEAGVGFDSFNMSHLVTVPGSLFYNAVGGLTAPLLNRQAIKAEYFSANNKQIQAIYRYEQTLIQAFTDVVNQMNMIKNLNEIYELKSKQVAKMEESVDVSNVLFQAARVDYIESLFTQRDALEARIEFVEVKKRQLSAYVNLYKAVGGGWTGQGLSSVVN